MDLYKKAISIAGNCYTAEERASIENLPSPAALDSIVDLQRYSSAQPSVPPSPAPPLLTEPAAPTAIRPAAQRAAAQPAVVAAENGAGHAAEEEPGTAAEESDEVA